MRTVLLASLRTHARRHVAAALAVVIGVTFVVATGGLSTAAARDGLTAGLSDPYDAADAVLTDVSGQDAVALKREHGDDASVLGWASEPVRHDGAHRRPRRRRREMPVDPGLRWPTLEDGTFPDAAGRGRTRPPRREAHRRRDRRPDRGRRRPVTGRRHRHRARRRTLRAGSGTVYLVWDDLAPSPTTFSCRASLAR